VEQTGTWLLHQATPGSGFFVTGLAGTHYRNLLLIFKTYKASSKNWTPTFDLQSPAAEAERGLPTVEE
jgi:hypothetical protein